jgi:hypothetical protein
MLGTRGRNRNALALVIYKSLPKLKAFILYLQYLHPQYIAPMIFSKNRDGELVTSRIIPSPLTNHHYPAKRPLFFGVSPIFQVPKPYPFFREFESLSFFVAVETDSYVCLLQ